MQKAWPRGNAKIEELEKPAGALVWRLDGAQEVGRSQTMLSGLWEAMHVEVGRDCYTDIR